ncbi:hypothetical protein ACFQ6C_07530 [Streptomyces sp. NPDC056454]|uniref:zinc finger domain-containing protein n=1 Tax=Streptomyces sp. NPDC056454 TaxID=3345823 RepID=UPI00368F181E
MRARFPQLAVRCPWPPCTAPVGELCSNAALGTTWLNKTHDVRLTAWVIHTTTCPICAAAPDSPCMTQPPELRTALPAPHPGRITEATYTATHRTPPWPHQPPTAPTAVARSGGPAPRPAADSPSIPTQTQPATPPSGATPTASSAPDAPPPTSP